MLMLRALIQTGFYSLSDIVFQQVYHLSFYMYGHISFAWGRYTVGSLSEYQSCSCEPRLSRLMLSPNKGDFSFLFKERERSCIASCLSSHRFMFVTRGFDVKMPTHHSLRVTSLCCCNLDSTVQTLQEPVYQG